MEAHRIVQRAFLTVEGRQMHYRRVGKGPPALFVHSSPTNGSFVLPDMLAQADRFTCFAFDTPGFGLSDPLPLKEMRVADLADALVGAMDALGLPVLPIFGTHSGAAIALEMGYRHPDRMTGLVLDGVPVFTREEVVPLQGPYFASMVADPLGGQYSATWTRFRDQSMWFPWCDKRPENLNEYDLSQPAVTHRWLEMFFAAAAYYKPAYWAVTSYCEGAIEAAAGLIPPAVFTATTTDMLHPHLARLPKLRANQRIADIGNDHERKRALTGESLLAYGAAGPAPALARTLEPTDGVLRQFVMDGSRAQMLRYAGDPANPVMLLLHDVPGSSLMVEADIRALAQAYFVIAPDLPGSGESEALEEGADLATYGAALWRMCDTLGLVPAVVRGLGFSATLALTMAADRAVPVQIDGLCLADAAARADLRAHYAPIITIERDGAHWYRTWLMLRDSLVYWPWYDSRRVALRRTEQDFDAWKLHYWTVEVMKQWSGYHRLIHAILDCDGHAVLARAGDGIEWLAEGTTPVAQAYAAQVRAISG